MMQEIINNICKIKHGFKPIELEAKKIFAIKTIKETLLLAKELYKSKDYQVRCLAIFLLGYCASEDVKALEALREEVSADISWQVHEILAKAFDQFCKDNGYENSLPIIKSWLLDTDPKVCRAVTEGLRIWTRRPYFCENPLEAIQLLSQHRASESAYLRKSVGNAIRDISRQHNYLVMKEVEAWELEDELVAFTNKYVMKNRR